MTYISNLLFTELLGLKVQYLTEPTIGQQIHIIYGDKRILDELLIKPIGLLSENGVNNWEVDVFDWESSKGLFRTNGADWEFDLLSASFYLISRYEEYLPYRVDKHNRYAHDQSLAFREDFLHLPLVNIWMKSFAKLLNSKYPELKVKFPEYKFINTIDVDNAYAYLEKGFVRTLGAFARSIVRFDFNDVKERFLTILGRMKDPFDNFDELITAQKKYGFTSIYFWLLADYDVNDKNVPYTSRKFKSLIKSINDYAYSGIHPSYASNHSEEKLKTEIERLSEAIHMPVQKSRQHFLKFKMPDTYKTLVENEVYEDYSMGYPSELGFRASICSPFKFYDLTMEQATPLTIYPFYLMEATLKYYKEVDPDHAMSFFLPIIEEVKKVNGTLISLWHNDSLSDKGEWKGWNKVYHDFLKEAMDS